MQAWLRLFTMNNLGMRNGSGYVIMPEYGTGGDLSGFSSIGIRWIAKYMVNRGLQSTYLGWWQANANAAFGVRRTSDNLSWCQWFHLTPAGNNLNSFDCLDSVSALQNVPAGGSPIMSYYMIVNKNSGLAMDLISGNTANGAAINQWTPDTTSAHQRWAIVPTENQNHFKIISYVTGKAASIAYDSTANGAQLWDWDYNSDASQQFDLVDAGNGWFKIKNVRSGMLLDVDSGSLADGAKVQQWTDAGTPQQLRRLQSWGNYYLRANSGRYVVCSGRGTANSTAIVQYDGETNPLYQWSFSSVSDGWYSCFSLYLSRLICVRENPPPQARS